MFQVDNIGSYSAFGSAWLTERQKYCFFRIQRVSTSAPKLSTENKGSERLQKSSFDKWRDSTKPGVSDTCVHLCRKNPKLTCNNLFFRLFNWSSCLPLSLLPLLRRVSILHTCHPTVVFRIAAERALRCTKESRKSRRTRLLSTAKRIWFIWATAHYNHQNFILNCK